MVTGHAASSSDDDEFAFTGNDFAAAKEYDVLARIGGGTFGEVRCCNAALATCKHALYDGNGIGKYDGMVCNDRW